MLDESRKNLGEMSYHLDRLQVLNKNTLSTTTTASIELGGGPATPFRPINSKVRPLAPPLKSMYMCSLCCIVCIG